MMSENIWWIIGGLAFTLVVTVVVAVVQSKKADKSQKPVWAFKTEYVIGVGSKSTPELKLTFDGNPVDRVYETDILLMNIGKLRIEKTDMSVPICFKFKDSKILRTRKVTSSRPTIGFSTILKEPVSIECGFDYLAKDDGVVIEILHTKDDFVAEPLGEFKDAKLVKLKKLKKFPEKYDSHLSSNILLVGLSMMGGLME